MASAEVTRRLTCGAMVLVALGLVGSCTSRSSPSDAAETPFSVHDARSYNSIDDLLADTKLLVVATATSVRPDHSVSGSAPRSLVTMKVDEVVRGRAGSRIVVSELGGQLGDVVKGQVPIVVGRPYLMCLGLDPTTGVFYVLNGITGLFRYNPETQMAQRIDPKATWIPQAFTLAEARGYVASLAQKGLGPAPTPTSSTTTSTSTTEPPVEGTCPPGCRLPSDTDAITVMASSATLVAIVTAHEVQESGSVVNAHFSTDQVLQGNAYDNVYPVTGTEFGVVLGPPETVVDGMTYLVFMSFNRGGSCVSSLFSYDPTRDVARFIAKNDSPQASEILLSGRVLRSPRRSRWHRCRPGCTRPAAWCIPTAPPSGTARAREGRFSAGAGVDAG